MLKRIGDNESLTDEFIKNALQTHASMFAEYLKEKYLWNLALSVIAKNIYDSTLFLNQVKSWILNDDPSLNQIKRYLLERLLVANPLLVEMIATPEEEMQLSGQLQNARKQFEQKLLEHHAIARRAWQDAIKLQRKANEERVKNFNATLDKIKTNGNSDYQLPKMRGGDKAVEDEIPFYAP